VLLAALALLLTFPLIARDRQANMQRTFDLPGALSATLGVTSLVFALVQGPTFRLEGANHHRQRGCGPPLVGSARHYRAAQ
jgi:hypothetical protein